MDQETLCRPDKDHYCFECCKRDGQPCAGLGPLPDGTKGCQVYQGSGDKGFSKPPFCDDVNCLSEDLCDPKILERIREHIANQPTGEFSMTKILRNLGLYPRTPKSTIK